MSERERRTFGHPSVFVKLVAIMLTMAASLLLMVFVFFWHFVTPRLNASIERVVEEYARVVAATSPDLETAKQLGARLDLEMRYEGPDAVWATTDNMPTIEQVRRWEREGTNRWFRARGYSVVAGPKGGTYLIAWDFSRRMLSAHAMLLVLLLFLMGAVVLAAHAVLSRLLRPLRRLGEGVARLGEGHLDVVLSHRTRDEFGALTEAFNHMVRRVKEMIDARDQLLLDVSHELRSPLTRMKVALELLPDGEQRSRMTADIREMELMLTELLELERLRDGRAIRTARHDLMPILRDVADGFHDRHPGVRLVSTAATVLLEIDDDKVRIVLRNLLENAVKYSLPDSGAVEVSVVPNGEIVVVRVTDDGPGIPERDMSNLFEPFFRVDRSRSKKTGGYGLGLSICKRIMEAHGGAIAVENNARRGASFVLTWRKPA
jgi:signal transduction histidine kinase